jgi:hypothetical protein
MDIINTEDLATVHAAAIRKAWAFDPDCTFVYINDGNEDEAYGHTTKIIGFNDQNHCEIHNQNGERICVPVDTAIKIPCSSLNTETVKDFIAIFLDLTDEEADDVQFVQEKMDGECFKNNYAEAYIITKDGEYRFDIHLNEELMQLAVTWSFNDVTHLVPLDTIAEYAYAAALPVFGGTIDTYIDLDTLTEPLSETEVEGEASKIIAYVLTSDDAPDAKTIGEIIANALGSEK